jgi:hypothetical protein
MIRPTQGHPQANKERRINNEMSIQWDPFDCLLYVLCWPEDGPVLAETCRLNVNIIDFNTLLS